MIQPLLGTGHNPAFSTTPHKQKLAQPQAPVQFSGLPGNAKGLGNKLLKHFDYREFGASHVNQIQIIYASCILWRLVAANERRKASPTKSWNEIRESALRDSIGYAFWFFGTPTLQRAYLLAATRNNPAMRDALIQKNPALQHTTGLLGFLKRLNLMENWRITSSEQTRNQMEQALHGLKKAGIAKTDPAYLSTETYFKELMKHRNLATAVGLGSTIALLGFGINFFNFYLTHKDVERRKAALKKPTFPGVPSLPYAFHLSPNKPAQQQSEVPAFMPTATPSQPPIFSQSTPFQTS